jgi:surface carbohydrate biosynthesis protein (TIGR04326 family)
MPIGTAGGNSGRHWALVAVTAPVFVWDRKKSPTDLAGEVLYWQSYAQEDGTSVPRYLEDHAERLRAKYLAFIQDLGEIRIGAKRLVDHLALNDGFSFWSMTLLAEKSPFKSPRIYTCLRLLALEEILRDRKPAQLILVSPDRDLARSIRILCRNLGIDFKWRLSGRFCAKWSLRRAYYALPFSLQGATSFIRYLVERWPVHRFKKPQWFSGDDAIFLCSFFAHLDPDSCKRGDFYSHQWGILPKWLHDGGRRTNWLHHFLPTPEIPDPKAGLSWLSRFNANANRQGKHLFLDSYLTWDIVARALRNWLWLNTVGWRLGDLRSAVLPQGFAAWLWPVLRDDWHASLSGPVAVNNCLWVELFDAALKDIPPQKKGLYLCENQSWERALLRAWRKYGHGEIIGVAHATVPFWHLYYFDDPRSWRSKRKSAMPLPDRLAVNGPAAWMVLVESGYPIERLIEVEVLRYLKLSRTTSKRVLDPARIKVLVLGDIIPESMQNLLKMLGNVIKRTHLDSQFTFKPHPLYAIELADYPDLLEVKQVNEPLDRILSDFDIVLSANSTSAAVDAYQVGLQVIIGLEGTSLNLSPLRGQPGVRFIGTPDDLMEALRAAGENHAAKMERPEFFFLDSELPRWRRLLF